MMIMRIHYAFLVDEIPKNKRSGDSKQTIQYIMSKVCLPEMCRSAFDLLFFVGLFPLRRHHTRVIILVLYFV